MTFVPGRDQDASSTIRGFVYQAECTILRWLALPPSQVLQLECGEDIDSVVRVGDASTSERSRLMEQIKDIQRAATLRAPGPVASLVAFHSHRAANLGHNLRFRFTTTASIGRERPSPLPKGVNGITLWETVRLLPATQAPNGEDIAGLRSVLLSAAKPEDVPQTAWDDFRRFIETSDAAAFTQFVRFFEWSTGSGDTAQVEMEIVSRLQEVSGTNVIQATILHDKLFAFVFRTLAKSGIKELTATDLKSQLEKPVLSGDDRALLQGLQGGVLRNALRLGSLEARVDQVEATTSALMEHVSLSTQGLGLTEAAILPVLDAPPLVARLAKRTTVVKDILRNHPKAIWIALEGIAGSGKSHLAGLIAQCKGGRLRWMALRDLQTSVLPARISYALTRGSHAAATGAARTPAIKPGDVLVLDDLPALGTSPVLQAFLVRLLVLCEQAGAFIISTSGLALPQALRDAVGARGAHLPAPPFSVQEVHDLCAQAGAPAGLLADNMMTIMRATWGGGHPVLVSAGIDYLRGQQWKLDQKRLFEIFAGAHTASVATDTLRRVVESVTQDTCKELLYRLCMADGPLSLDDIKTLAAIPPSSTRYLECLQSLEGVWLQPAGNGLFEPSPLVKKFGPLQLDAAVKKQASRFMAERILRSQPMDQLDVMRACTHLILADEHNQATSLVMWASSEFRRAGVLHDAADIVLMLYPPDRDFPTGLDLALGVMLRAAQTRAAIETQKDPMPYVKSLHSASTQLREDQRWGTVGAAAQLMTAPAGSLPLEVVLDATEVVERAEGKLLIHGHAEQAVPMWATGAGWLFAVAAAKTWPHAWMILERFDRLSTPRKQALLAQETFRSILLILVDGLMIGSAEGKAGALSQADALAELRRLADWSRKRGYGWIAAAAVRGIIVIAVEYQNEHDKLGGMASDALADLPEHSPARALVKKTWGEQLEFAGDHRGALEPLRDALATSGVFSPDYTALTMLTAAEAAFHVDLGEALTWSERAVLMAQTEDFRDPGLEVRAYAELAIVRWKMGRRGEAFDALDKAVDQLFTLRMDHRLKNLFVRIGHIAGFYATVATTGAPPPATSANTPYVEPSPAFMRGAMPAADRLYRNASGASILASQLAMLANALGNTERAAAWSEWAFQDAVRLGVPLPISFAAAFIIQSAISSGKFDQAFEAAILGGLAMRAAMNEQAAGRDPSREEFRVELDPLLDDKEARKTGEPFAALLLLTPLAIRVIEEGTNDQKMRAAALTIAQAATKYGASSAIPEGWNTVAEVFRAAADAQGGSVLRDLAKEESINKHLAIQPIAYLLASVHRGVNWTTSLQLQCGCLKVLLQFAGVDLAEGRIRLARAITVVWRGRFARLRSGFSSPSAIDEKLTEAAKLPPIDEMKSVLRAMVEGLRCSLAPEAADWLASPST